MPASQTDNHIPHRFALILEAPASDLEPNIRLRRALKCLLRVFNLRCLRVEPADYHADCRATLCGPRPGVKGQSRSDPECNPVDDGTTL